MHSKTGHGTVWCSVYTWGSFSVFVVMAYPKPQSPSYLGCGEKNYSASIKRLSQPWLQSLPCSAPSYWPDGPGLNLGEAAGVAGPHISLSVANAVQAVRNVLQIQLSQCPCKIHRQHNHTPCSPHMWSQTTTLLLSMCLTSREIHDNFLRSLLDEYRQKSQLLTKCSQMPHVLVP